MKVSSDCEYEATCQINIMESFLELFMEIHESPAASLKTLDNEKLKKAFRLAFAIENFMDRLGELEHSTNLIRTMLRNKKLPPDFDFNILKKACDVLLEKFFTHTEHSLLQTEVAVRIYTSMMPLERYEEFICNLLMESASYQAIQEFVFQNEHLDIKTLQFKLLLHEWVLEYRKGKTEELITLIQNMMSPYKVEQSLSPLIGIIALDTDTKEENEVRQIVLKEVLEKMFGRSILSRKFWITLFEIDQNLLLTACIASEEFHVSICNFLIYIGCMMDLVEEEGKKKWKPNLTTTICPEFTYDLLVAVLQPLFNFVKREVTIEKFLIAEEETQCALLRHLLKLL